MRNRAFLDRPERFTRDAVEYKEQAVFGPLSNRIDLPAANGDTSYELPVPATYVIDVDGIIRAAYIDKDYTKRMEPQDILAALKAI